MTRVRHDGGVSGVSNEPTIGSASGIWTLKDAEKYIRNDQWPAFYGNEDQYFPYNSVLIHADGVSGGADNTLFVDSSVNLATITRTGTPTQGSFSPFSTTGWSNYFNTGSDAYSFPSTAGMALGASGNATIECWAYFSSFPGLGAYIFNKDGASTTNYPEYGFYFSNAFGNLNLSIGVSTGFSSVQNIPFGVIKTGTWYHIAACRIGTTWTLFLNGSIVNTATQTVTPTARTSSFYVGNQSGGTQSMFGTYISNLRVIVGSALYTSNFLPPLTTLTNVTNTVVLTCQNNRFVENINNGTNTVAGAPQVQPFSPFNPTSAYSNTTIGGSILTGITTSDGLTIPYSTSTGKFTGDFTVECWFYIKNLTGTQTVFTHRTTGYAPFWVEVASGKLTISMSSTNSSWDIINGQTLANIVANQWYHYALVRSGSSIKSYVNGVNVGGGGTSSATLNTSTLGFRVGCTTSTSEYFNGNISNVRMVNGTALYTSNFTPPTAPLTAITNTTFLLNGTNGGIFDQAQKSDFMTAGSVAVSNTQSQFGGGSMYFPGTGYVRAPHTTILDLSTGAPNFTVECWFYTTNNSAAGPIVSKDWNQGTTNPSYGIYLGGSTTLVYMIADATSGSIYNQYTYTGIAINTWYHVALVRNGSNMLSFLNGVLVNIQNISITSKDNGTTFNIGTNNNTGSYFNGYIDEVRITKGIARYTSNFTPQTSAFLNN